MKLLITVLIVAGIGFLALTKNAKIPPSPAVPNTVFSSPTSQDTPKLTPTPTINSDHKIPYAKYKFYGGVDKIYNEQAKSINSVFVKNGENLPKSIILDGETIVVKKWEIYQVEKGFGAYAYIEFNNKEGKIGFWYSEDGVPNPAYGGVLSFETRKRTDPPTEEEKKQGIRGTYYEESINLIGIDYNLTTNDWNFVQLDKSLYTEKLLPLKPL